MAREVKQWITVNGQHVPIYEGESKDDAVNRSIAEKNEATKAQQIANNKAQADSLNSKEPGKIINGKFYTIKQLKNMTLDEMRALQGGQLGGGKPSNDDKRTTSYSFSSDKSLSDTEKDWLEQAVDWAKGEDNMPMVGMNTISNYYGVKFGKSASVIKEIKSDGEILFTSMNKTLLNQAFDNVAKLKQAIKTKEQLK